MKKLMNRIDRFCYTHPRFGIDRLMLYIVAGNALVWLLAMMDTTGLLTGYLTFSATGILRGQIWRLVTFIFVPESGSIFFLLMLYFYYFIGSSLEREWGAGRFTVYYLSGMLLTILYGFVSYFATGLDRGLTAEYINLSMFFAFATLFPDTMVLFFFFIPLKVKWLAVLDAVYFAYEIVRMLAAGYGLVSFLPLIAILNYLLFCGGWIFDYFRPARAQQRKKTVDFKKAAARVNRELRDRPYTRRCEVCGRTDADHPELEFRYCSRCAGYHCFCQDHINNHVHFTE